MENDVIKKMLETILENQKSQISQIHTMNNNLTQLTNTVIGNETFGQTGLVKEVAEIKKYVERDKLLKSKVWGGLVVIGVVWTALIELITKYLKD